MLAAQSLPWREPLDLATTIDQPWWVLLYSGARADYSGRYSYLACDLAERIESSDFSAFERRLTADQPRFANAWFGYLAYELKDCLEALPPAPPNWLTLPKLCMMRFSRIYRFDHQEQRLTCWSEKDAIPALRPHRHALPNLPAVSSISSNMTDSAYLEKAAHIIERIHAGDLYQANLTRKYAGRFSQSPDSFSLFSRLCRTSPAPYSAFLRLGERCILSSSPELFLHIDEKGAIHARPIKGTAPRHTDTAQDAQSRARLAASDKDRAENLMIADLMRNDLSRGCVAGSVRAESLFDVTTHATIHHMSSTISGMKRAECSTLDAVCHCFPPGSMTGAPKLEAMKLCSRLEEVERGIYSGAIGWFGGDGVCELSVVIRTLILQDDRFEFQIGGGIVADSTPDGELKELIDKSRGILAALDLKPKDLQANDMHKMHV